MAISTTSELNGYFDSIYEDTLFVAREQNLMTGLVTPYSAKGWMARKITKYPSITAVPIAEGVDFSGATTWDKQLEATLTPGQVITQVLLTDQRIDTDPEDARRDASTEMGNAIAGKIDVDLCAVFASFTTDKGAGAGNNATIAKVAAAIAKLRALSVPNPIYVVLHPFQWYDIWTELGQPAAQRALLGDVANKALQDYFVGSWLNVDWFTSANIATDSGDDAVGAVFHPQAIAFDSRQRPSLEPERDASKRAYELNMTAGYAAGIRRNAFGVKFTSDAAEP